MNKQFEVTKCTFVFCFCLFVLRVVHFYELQVSVNINISTVIFYLFLTDVVYILNLFLMPRMFISVCRLIESVIYILFYLCCFFSLREATF